MIVGLKILLLLAGIFGNCWFWASFVSRLYAIPCEDRILDRWRKLSDVSVVVIPILLAVSLFFRPQSAVDLTVMYAGVGEPSWPVFDWWLLPWSFSLVGIVFFLSTRLRRRLMRRPEGFAVVKSRVIDIAAELGSRPYGRGKYLSLTKWPGNEVFTVELNEKRFQLPGLPLSAGSLKVLHLSDLHYQGAIGRAYFEKVMDHAAACQADLIVFTGDLLDRQDLIDWLPGTLGKLSAPLGCYYILGNHDWHLEPEPIRQAMNELGWLDCGGTVHEVPVSGARVWIGGDERPWMGKAADFSAAPEGEFRILLSHTPDNIYWAQEQKIDLVLSGHNHGGQVQIPGIGPFLAPSRYGVRFAGGEFWLSPTTLHVSRGVSGRHPLRYRCRPEVTLLHLEKQGAGHATYNSFPAFDAGIKKF